MELAQLARPAYKARHSRGIQMYRVHCQLDRPEAERLSDLLAGLDPSPASAVSVEEVSKTMWSLDAFCIS